MHTPRIRLLLTLVLLGVLAPAAHAQTPFASDLDFIVGITQLDDGRILVVQGGEQGNVLSFDTNGTALANFASTVEGPGAVTQLADGRILLSTFANQNVLAFASDGTPLTTFAEGIPLPFSLTQLVDGRVLVTEPISGNVTAFNADGTGRMAFATGLDFPDRVIQLQDGRVLVNTSPPNGGLVLAFDPDGTRLPDFASTDFPVGAMTQLSDGRVLLAQVISGDIATFAPDGTALPDLGTAGADPRAMTQLADGRLLVTDQGGTVFAFEVETASDAFAQIQLFDETPDYQDAIGGGASDIVEMPDGSLGIFFKVQDRFQTQGPDRLYISTSSDGTTWSAREELDTGGHQAICCMSAAADAETGRVVALYFNADANAYRILYSDDGETWTNIAAPSLFQETTVYDLAAAPGGGFAAVMGTTTPGGDFGPAVVTTSADGLTWGNFSAFTEEFNNGAEICSSSIIQRSATDLLVLYDQCDFRFGSASPIRQVSSADNGVTWSAPVTAITSEISFGRRMDATRAADGTLWMIHTNAEDLFYTSSTDGGATWAPSERWTDNAGTPSSPGQDNSPAINMYAGQPMVLFDAIRPENEFNHFYYGIPGVSSDPLSVAIEEVSSFVPETVALAQNYPNPFSGATTIRFSITEAAPVTLTVYDLMGREVKRLVGETLVPGTYEANFDGSGLASGSYLYRLVAGGASTQRQLTLIR
ncbi:MAG: T9SS type A sorting domain-containing protein [Bacteroidota bacterium]